MGKKKVRSALKIFQKLFIFLLVNSCVLNLMSCYHVQNNNCMHEYEKTFVYPTCVENGYEFYICHKCGYSYKVLFENKLGHEYGNYIIFGNEKRIRNCTRCSYKEEDNLDNIIDWGKCGENLYWTLYNNKLLKIVGKGRSYDYVKGLLIGKSEDEIIQYVVDNPDKAERGFQEGKTYDHENQQYVAPWYKYREETFFSGEVDSSVAYTTRAEYEKFNPEYYTYDRIEIESGVEYLGDWLFYRVCGPQELIIPETVNEFGRWTIRFSPTLKKVVLPNSLKKMGERACSRLEVIEEIQMGTGLETVGDYAFAQNHLLEEIIINSNIKNFGQYSFGYNKSLKYVEFKSIINIPIAQFVDCHKLKTIVFPENIETIEHCAFVNLNLTQIKIPKSVKEIIGAAFYNNFSLDTVYIDSPIIAKALTYSSSCGFIISNAKNVYVNNAITDIGKYITDNYRIKSVENDYTLYTLLTDI